MNLKYLERLIISIVIFLGVTIGTIGIVRNYYITKQKADNYKQNHIILGVK